MTDVFFTRDEEGTRELHQTEGVQPPQQRGPGVDVAQFLPPGADPNDRSVVLVGDSPQFHGDSPVPDDYQGKQYQTGHAPYNKDAWEALPVFQRSSVNGSVKIVVVNLWNGGTALAAAAQRGRLSVTMSVPSKLPDGVTVPNGVTWSFSQGDLQGAGNNDCGILNPGDSVTIQTEAEIWLGLIGANTTGAAQVITLNNPPTGPGVA